MDIGNLGTVDRISSSGNRTVEQKNNNEPAQALNQPPAIAAQSPTSPDKEKKEWKAEEIKEVVEEANQFMGVLNTDIRFAMHEKTNQIMVQVFDRKDNRVLREYPSKEFLDTIAKIRDMIGVFLDVKI